MRPVLVGAVVYDPKVVTIWEIIRRYFAEQGVPMEPVFYGDYTTQVQGLLDGQVDVAWNSPLAWVDAQRRSGGTCRAIAMRDTDRDRQTRFVVRRESGYGSLADLAGRPVGFGAQDSPQAHLIPLRRLMSEGIDVTVRRFDVKVGLHGDHVGGERDAFDALAAGEVEAACVLDLNWELWTSDGTADPARFEALDSTEPFDHCVFTVRADFDQETERLWLAALHSMSYDNPEHREMMDMEGLKAWQPGRTDGFAQLEDAVARLGYFQA